MKIEKGEIVNSISMPYVLLCSLCHNAMTECRIVCIPCSDQNKWFRIEDKKPEHNDWILAFNGKAMCVCWFDKSSFDYVFMWGMSASQQFKNVTHWMPLPYPREVT